MFKIRFHLGAGENFGKWQVKGPDGVQYFDPATTTLVLFGCKLKNRKRTAQKIKDGAHKTVCAHVKCDTFVHFTTTFNYEPSTNELKYNPKICTHWHNRAGDDLDGARYNNIFSFGKKLFTYENSPS